MERVAEISIIIKKRNRDRSSNCHGMSDNEEAFSQEIITIRAPQYIQPAYFSHFLN